MTFPNYPKIKSKVIFVALATLTFCNVYADIPLNPVITDANWGIMNTTFPPGTNGKIIGMVKYRDNIYVCGKFTSAGGIKAINIAKWDGSKWSSLGYEADYEDADGGVSAICVDKNGYVYASEMYWAITPTSATAMFKLKMWDGVNWQQCNTGNRGIIECISADSSGNIYIGGQFDTVGGVHADNIAKWNGSQWDSLQSGLYTPESNAIVKVLITDKSGILYAGGDFTRAGAIPAKSIAKWDGSAWDSFKSEMSATIYAIALNKKGDLYVGGDIEYINGTDTRCSSLCVVRWNGSQWDPVGSEKGYCVSAIAFDSSGNLYAGNLVYGNLICGEMATGEFMVEKWDGNNWQPLNIMTSPDYNVMSISSLLVDGFDNVFAAGEFTYAGNKKVNNIARFDGTKWSALGTGFDGCINKLTFDGSANLYAAGEFTTINTDKDSAFGVAKWNGNTWSAIGSGTGSVYKSSDAIAIDHSNNVLVSVSSGEIIKWDGNAWIYAGFRTDAFNIDAIVVDTGGFLYSTGGLKSPTTSWNQYVSKCVDGRWMTIGSNFNGRIYSLAFDNASNLYAGGQFDTIWDAIGQGRPSKISNISKWDGQNWIDIGAQQGSHEWVNVLLFDKKGKLYAGGFFDSTGGKPTRNIAMWDGTAWSDVGSGVDSTVKALALDSSGNLYAGGDFNKAGGVVANHIARWDGKEWSSLGSGTDNSVNALAVHKSTLYVGGEFMNSGNKFTPYIARVNILPGENISSKRPVNNSRALHCQIVNRTLYTSNVLPKDKVFVYSLSGRLLLQHEGNPAVHLYGFSPQILIVYVVRDGTIILNDRILLQ